MSKTSESFVPVYFLDFFLTEVSFVSEMPVERSEFSLSYLSQIWFSFLVSFPFSGVELL